MKKDHASSEKILAEVERLADQGLQLLPVIWGQKAPIVSWKKYQGARTQPLLKQWFGGVPRNVWMMTGQKSMAVTIDIDNEAGYDWWVQVLGRDVLHSGAEVTTGKGRHFHFKIPSDYYEANSGQIASWSPAAQLRETDGPSFDFRADGTGVIIPPSVHESGRIYTWVTPIEDAAFATPEMLNGSLRDKLPQAEADGVDSVKGTGGVTRSMLTSLLSKPPGGSGSGRNDWMARVAGHYAKTYHAQQDLYEMHCSQANSSMGEPLDDTEFRKTIESIWKGEHERNSHRELDSSCGWLQSANFRILTQKVKTDPQGDKTYELAEYANFDLVAKGVMLDEMMARTYWVDIVRRDPRNPANIERIETVMPASTFGDERALSKWLSSFACTVLPPTGMWPREGKPGLRLQRYLESQNPPQVRVMHSLGWDDNVLDAGAFITHEGAITQYGPITAEDSGVTANPVLKKGASQHHYGFERTWEVAQDTLREVMTFHDETTTAIFGSWWAACLLKPQIEATTALFPFMAIQAPSESGKTNGYFDMMTQLNGNTRGETQPTRAALRDMAAANKNGIVWVDDLDDPMYLMELLRAATSGGSLTKMGEDRQSVKNTPIVAPIVISGESLGIENQKALVDRAVSVKVPSPVGRVSLYNPDRPQWDDILDVRREFPGGLACLAGWFIQKSLGVTQEVLLAVQQGRHGVQGRAADKVGILRGGAQLLDYLLSTSDAEAEAAWLGEGPTARRLETWIMEEVVGRQIEGDNSLTMTILPWAIQMFGYPTEPIVGENGQVDTPLFFKYLDEGTSPMLLDEAGTEAWINTAYLALAWERHKNGRIQPRTESATALKEQASALKSPSKRFKLKNSGGKLAYYRKIDGEMLARVIARAQDR